MDDRTALLQAVTAAPDDDLPRLVFADWLEEHDEGDYAAFIRAQVELAGTPAWEPFAVRCRHFGADTIARGTPWLTQLPPLRPGLEWHPEAAFRRGFAWGLIVREMPVFMIEAERLFAAAPIGQLHLPTATLDQWRWFGEQPWLPRVKSVHFYGLSLPTEPLSVLCESPFATGLDEIVFEVSRGLATPLLIERLFQSPRGQQLRSLKFRGIDQVQDELIAALTSGPVPPQLTHLAFHMCRFLPEHLEQLAESPALETLTGLEFQYTPLDEGGLRSLLNSRWLERLSRLTLAGVDLGHESLMQLAGSPHLGGLRMLSLRRNWNLGQLRPLVWRGMLNRLRALGLSETLLADRSVRPVVNHWANLTELNVSQNRLTGVGMRPFLSVAVPPNLAALVAGANSFSQGTADDLKRRFGDRLIL